LSQLRQNQLLAWLLFCRPGDSEIDELGIRLTQVAATGCGLVFATVLGLG
jgi:hypothetical protein